MYSEIHIHRQIRPLNLADIPPNSPAVLIGLLMPNMKRHKRRKGILRLIGQTVGRIRRGRPCSPAGVPFHTGRDQESEKVSSSNKMAAGAFKAPAAFAFLIDLLYTEKNV